MIWESTMPYCTTLCHTVPVLLMSTLKSHSSWMRSWRLRSRNSYFQFNRIMHGTGHVHPFAVGSASLQQICASQLWTNYDKFDVFESFWVIWVSDLEGFEIQSHAKPWVTRVDSRIRIFRWLSLFCQLPTPFWAPSEGSIYIAKW